MAEADSTVEYRDLTPFGFPGYRVGDDGSVWSRLPFGPRASTRPLRPTWRRLKPQSNGNGYRHVGLHINAKGFTHLIHGLVLLAFAGPCPDGMQGAHDDGNRANNALSNLRYDTPKGNSADRVRHGTLARGERQGPAKLTEAAVRGIRAKHAVGGVIYQELAEEYHVSKTLIGAIIRREAWTHVA